MQTSEFIEATSRLEIYYGKEYSVEQRTIMYDELKDMEISRYRKIISAVIRKSKFLPKIADIIEANIEEPYSSQNQENKVECSKCKSTGYVLYTKIIKNGDKENKYTYGAICNCGNAKKYEGWTIADTQHRTDFYTPYASELGLI